MTDIAGLIRQVKENCNISDAEAWGYYSLCGLLLRVRSLYLNEHALMPWDQIPQEVIGPWIGSREALWQSLDQRSFHDIVIEGKRFGPFDINAMNDLLMPQGIVYGCGYGIFRSPTFFLARLVDVREELDYRIYRLGDELCRDLTASPAVVQGRCIYIRSEVLRAIVWDKFLEFRAKPRGGLSETMFSPYHIRRTDGNSPDLYEKIEAVVRDAAWLFEAHEVGEAYEDECEEEWFAILSSTSDKYTDLYLRGIKDVLADTSAKGPLRMIADRSDRTMMAVFMVFLDGIRKDLFPEIRHAYQEFIDTDDWRSIERARLTGYRKAASLRDTVLDGWRKSGQNPDRFASQFRQVLMPGTTPR